LPALASSSRQFAALDALQILHDQHRLPVGVVVIAANELEGPARRDRDPVARVPYELPSSARTWTSRPPVEAAGGRRLSDLDDRPVPLNLRILHSERG
jgi:hypothetical protein